MSVDESRQLIRRVQTNVDDCRRIKSFFFHSWKSGTWSHFIAVAIMQQQATSVCSFSIFVVLSDNVLTPHISKTHLPIVSLNVREVELNWRSKDQSRKKGGHPAWGRQPNSPRKALRFIKKSSLSSERYALSECGSI